MMTEILKTPGQFKNSILLFCGIKKNITFATCFERPLRVVF